jgi:hypothetical protein
VHIYNPTLVSELKFNYVRPLTTAERPEANDEDLGQFLGFQNINYPDDPITAGMPWFEPRPLSYAAIGDPTFIPMTTENHNYQVAGSVTKTLKRTASKSAVGSSTASSACSSRSRRAACSHPGCLAIPV